MVKPRHKVGTIILSTECRACKGHGQIYGVDPENDTESVICGDCDGLGFFTTEDGAILAAFLHELRKLSKE